MLHEAKGEYAAVVDDLFARVDAERNDKAHPPTEKEIEELSILANLELDREEAAKKGNGHQPVGQRAAR